MFNLQHNLVAYRSDVILSFSVKSSSQVFFESDNFDEIMDVSECLNINQRLNFDEMSCDEEEDSSEVGSGATGSTNNSGEIFYLVLHFLRGFFFKV